MSLPTNNNKNNTAGNKNQKSQPAGSKFIKGAASKPAPAGKKVRSTGANRGS